MPPPLPCRFAFEVKISFAMGGRQFRKGLAQGLLESGVDQLQPRRCGRSPGRDAQCPAFALVQLTAMAQAEIDGDVAGDGSDPAGKLRAIPNNQRRR